MNKKLLIYISTVLVFSTGFLARPSFNGTDPGCAGSGCHTFQANVVTATAGNNLQVTVDVTGASSGAAVAGELVDASNNVVDVNNGTNSNPFTLTAPQPGTYTVNAGYARPSRQYGTTTVEFTPSSLNIPTPSAARSNFELYPNHPNPFNNETIIRFSLPKGAHVELTVYDIRGQMISELANNYFTAGIHSVRWNGKTDEGQPVASGIYLCQIKSGEQRIVRSMLLSK
jgi:flagellar hook assembly protein FlgD